MASRVSVSTVFPVNETDDFSPAKENASCGNRADISTINNAKDGVALMHIVADYIYIVSSTIITLLGLGGNVLTLVVMTSKSFRSSSVAVYLSALATSDSLVLVMDDLNNWMRTVPKINLLALSDGFCKFHRFFFNVVYTYSAWIVTSVCIERFIMVMFPFRAKRICSYRNTVITVSLMPLPICALYLNNLWGWYANGIGCLVASSSYQFQTYVGPMLSAFAYSYVPVILLISLNVAIIAKLSLARRRRRQMSVGTSANEKQETHVTVTVVVICISYVIMTVPLGIYYTLAFKYGEFTNANPKYYLVRTIVNMFATLNYATNFFLYVLTSNAFRKQLRQRLCCCCCCFKSQSTGNVGSVDTGWSRMLTEGGKTTACRASDASIAVSSSSIATRLTDLTEDGRSVATLELSQSVPEENTGL